MLGYDWVGISCKVSECRQKFYVTAVSHRDNSIAAEAGSFGAADRRFPKHFVEFFRLHFGQPVEGGIDKAVAGLEFGGGGYGSFAVPGTNILTDIATKDVAADRGALLFRDLATLFDGQVGDAKAGIEFPGSNERLRWTGVDTAPAGAAIITRKRGVVFQLEVHDQRGDKKEGTGLPG